MLEPGNRTLLFDALRPPDGHRLDFCVGTTFSLDLMTLLTVPLAFSWFDLLDENEKSRTNSLELLGSLRRYAPRVVMFCQAGRISIPRSHNRLSVHLERAVVGCRSPGGGVFHPKVWVLRYVADDGHAAFRMLCLSRNLTVARSWDTLLALDGTTAPGRDVEDSAPLADFLMALPGLARHIDAGLREGVEKLAAEVRRVVFTTPPGVEALRFWPLGIKDHSEWPFESAGDRMLVVSPFVTRSCLERLSSRHKEATLVSTDMALSSLDRRPAGYQRFWMLNPDATPELTPIDEEGSGASLAEAVQLGDLHAKCYVSEHGRTALVWTGSANATDAAFSRNVEFLVQLTGSRSDLGIDSLMTHETDTQRLVDLLQDAGERVAIAPDPFRDEIEKAIEATRTALVDADMRAQITARDGDRYDILLRATEGDVKMPGDATVTCWPITLNDGHAQNVNTLTGPVAQFDDVSFEALTSFFAFRIELRSHRGVTPQDLVLNLPADGMPANRVERVLREMVRTPRQFVRLLLLLLGDGSVDPAQLGALVAGSSGDGRLSPDEASQSMPTQGLLEQLLRTLDRTPDQLVHVAAMLKDFGHRDPGETVVPPGFDEIWGPIDTIWKQRTACDAK
ncbi:MAG: phospholipase D family protein [Candidatus Rokubacteria bacterium]|nr:phospholipase D family protein [Candidatus Rokubacteria bacterium]